MHRQALRDLRLDRRLVRRRSWIPRQELERELAELPDVSHKIAPDEDTPDASQEPQTE